MAQHACLRLFGPVHHPNIFRGHPLMPRRGKPSPLRPEPSPVYLQHFIPEQSRVGDSRLTRPKCQVEWQWVAFPGDRQRPAGTGPHDLAIAAVHRTDRRGKVRGYSRLENMQRPGIPRLTVGSMLCRVARTACLSPDGALGNDSTIRKSCQGSCCIGTIPIVGAGALTGGNRDHSRGHGQDDGKDRP